jgi:hypothetical protein
MRESSVLEAALRYAARGWAVFPAPPGVKKSYKSAEHSDGRRWGATRDADEIFADFTRWPLARIGVTTSADSGIVVAETDTLAGHGIDGAAALTALQAKHGALPDTLQAISPSGSLHRYFGHPGPGITIKNSASALGRGIDVRGDGGMVIAPPSVNPGGGTYRWINDLPIAAMPAWLVELTRPKPPTISARAAVHAPRDGPRRLAGLLRFIATAPIGERNSTAFWGACRLAEMAAAGELSQEQALALAVEAASRTGLSHNEALCTARSAFRGAQ